MNKWLRLGVFVVALFSMSGTLALAHGGGDKDGSLSCRDNWYSDRLVGQCARVGPALQQWAAAALTTRGIRAIRLIQGVLSLTRRHPRERVLAAVAEAYAHQHFRYQTIRLLIERMPTRPTPTLATDDPAIRPMTQYTLEDFLR